MASLFTIRFGFIIAGLTNIVGVLLFSLGFQNPDLARLYPEFFSNMGLALVIGLGLLYIIGGFCYQLMPSMALAFGIVKLFYTGTWIYWWLVVNTTGIFASQSTPLTQLFFMSYGLIDLMFGLFFIYVYMMLKRNAAGLVNGG